MEGIAVKCPVCDQLNTSMLCPHCGFDASRDYENYPTFGIVRNVPSISALQAEQDIGRRTTKQLLDRVAELEHQMRSMTETNRLLLEKLSHLERAVSASNGQKPNRLREDPIRILDQKTYSLDDANAYPVFGSKLRRDQIASVTFLDTLADAPQDAWDVSADKSGSVMAWIVPRGKLYALFLAADGEIEAPESCKMLFDGYSNMRRIRFGSCFDTFRVKNMHSMFSYCSSLTELDLRSFDTSRVQNMGSMFYRCSSLTKLDLSSFNTSRVQNMGWMFSHCSSLTALDLSSFDISRVQNMDWMFYDCSSLTVLDLNSFDTSRVQDMGCMFSRCSSLMALDLSSFDTSKVRYMSNMFSGCSSLTALDLSSFNTSRVQDMSNMFSDCSSLTALDLKNFDTSNVTYMGRMFSRCSSLTTLDLRNFDTSNVTIMVLMFFGCSSLTTLKRSRFFVTTNAETDGMFDGCPAGQKKWSFL